MIKLDIDYEELPSNSVRPLLGELGETGGGRRDEGNGLNSILSSRMNSRMSSSRSISGVRIFKIVNNCDHGFSNVHSNGSPSS